MKKTTKVVLGVFALTLMISAASMTANSNNKVKLHHGNNLIELPPQAVAAHLAHKDVIHTPNNCDYLDCPYTLMSK